MYLRTRKQKLYFEEVIKLHLEKGYGEDRISHILPVGHSTVSRWIGIFASENDVKSVQMRKKKSQKEPSSSDAQPADVQAFQSELIRLQSQLKEAQLRADAFDEMINVAETKFKISIRKKVGAKR